jgi:four helix bundle protein
MTSKTPAKPGYDLEDRTATFGEAIIAFARRLPETVLVRPLTSQLIRAGTSVGANYCEADEAESKKDFRHKIGICVKEARETEHWLQMMVAAAPEHRTAAAGL